MYYSELSDQEKQFICEQIPDEKIKRFLQDHPKDTAKLYKGRVKSLSHEQLIKLLIWYEKESFISNFLAAITKSAVQSVLDRKNELESKGERNSQIALAQALSESIFADHVELYLKLDDKAGMEEYCAILQAYIHLLQQNRVDIPEPSSALEETAKSSSEDAISNLRDEHLKETERLEETIQSLIAQKEHLQQKLEQNQLAEQDAKNQCVEAEQEITALKHKLDAFENPPVPPQLFAHRSLCRVEMRERIWLKRLADYNGDTLYAFDADPNLPKSFDNRDRLYQKDGPKEIGAIGVWDWQTTPTYDDPEKDYVESRFCQFINPVEVIIFPGRQKVETLVEGLKAGVNVSLSAQRALLSVHLGDGTFAGLLVNSSQLVNISDKVTLTENTYSLQLYQFKPQMLIQIEDRWYFRKTNLGPARETIAIADPLDVVRRELLSRLTWQKAKEQGFIKRDWNDVKELIQSVNTADFEQDVMKSCGCSQEEARNYISDFIMKAEQYIRADDLDSRLLKNVAMQHTELRTKCMELLTEQWQLDYNKQRTEAEQVQSSLLKEITELERKKDALSSEYAAIQLELDSADERIEEKKKLANEVERMVTEKIAAARSDAASFLAEMAFWSPTVPERPSEQREKRAKRSSICFGTVLQEDEVEELHTWKEVLDALGDNLEAAGVAQSYRSALGTYLYSCFLNRTPVLLAGPFGREIADAFSLVLTGKTADYLDCSLCTYRRGMGDIQLLSSSVLVIDHPFEKEWAEHIPELSTLPNCFVMFTHPFREDLLIEPVGMMNYMIPILTELVIDHAPQKDYFSCCLSSLFLDFQQERTVAFHRRILKRIHVNSYITGKICRILTDYHGMSGDQNADHDCLLCLAPLAYLTEHADTLVEELRKTDSKSLPVSSDARAHLLQSLGVEE